MMAILRFLIIGVALTLWHAPVLHLPPTPDQAAGIWREAIYLSDSHFDYVGLRFQEKGPAHGGPFCYVISPLPTLLAVLMRILPSADAVIVAYHLFTIACAAAILAIVFEHVKSWGGTDIALLLTLAVATMPQFSAQVSLLGMDIPMTACALWALCLLAKRRYVGSAIVATLAFLVKPTGAIVTMATLIYLAFLTTLTRRRSDEEGRKLATAWRVNLCALAVQVSLLFAAGTYVNITPGRE